MDERRGLFTITKQFLYPNGTIVISMLHLPFDHILEQNPHVDYRVCALHIKVAESL